MSLRRPQPSSAFSPPAISFPGLRIGARRNSPGRLYSISRGPLQKSAVSNSFLPPACSRLAAELRPSGVKQRRQGMREQAGGRNGKKQHDFFTCPREMEYSLPGEFLRAPCASRGRIWRAGRGRWMAEAAVGTLRQGEGTTTASGREKCLLLRG